MHSICKMGALFLYFALKISAIIAKMKTIIADQANILNGKENLLYRAMPMHEPIKSIRHSKIDKISIYIKSWK